MGNKKDKKIKDKKVVIDENGNEVVEVSKKHKVFDIVATVVQVVLIVVCVVASIFIIANPGGYTKDPKDASTNMMVVMSDSMTPTIGENAIIFGDKVGKEPLKLGTVVTFSKKVYDAYVLNTHRIVGYAYTYKQGETTVSGKVYYKKGEVETVEYFDSHKDLTFIGYVTRGDKYSKMYGCKEDDFNIYKEDGSIDYGYDDAHEFKPYLAHEDVLAVWNGRKVEGVGAVIKFLQKPLNFALVILLPLVLLFAYNIFLIVKVIIADKSEKARKAALEEAKANMVDEEELKKKAIAEYLASLEKEKAKDSEVIDGESKEDKEEDSKE